jgi:hypothetical protein
MAAAFYWRALERAGCEVTGSMDIVNRWSVTPMKKAFYGRD